MKYQTILVDSYPSNFWFRIRSDLPKFEYACPKRTKLVRHHMRRLRANPTFHGYGDFVVAKIEKTPMGEIWHLDS